MAEMQARFIEQFHRINENFKRTFSALFRGGEAELRLADESRAMECDIEIRDGGGNLILSSQAFTIEIEKSMRDESAIESSNEFTALEKINAAEAARVKAEAARVEAEKKRVTAENGRVSAETERQKQLALMKTATTEAENAKRRSGYRDGKRRLYHVFHCLALQGYRYMLQHLPGRALSGNYLPRKAHRQDCL